MKHLSSDINRQIYQYRLGTGLTQDQVSNSTGISSSSISLLERGMIINPTSLTIWILAEFYSTQLPSSADDIFLNMQKELRHRQKRKAIDTIREEG